MAWLQKSTRLNRNTNRKETYWRIAYRDDHGKKRTKAIGFATKSEAGRLLKIFEGKAAAGEVPKVAPPPSAPGLKAKRRIPTLTDYMNDVFLPVVKRDKAAKTLEGAQRAANVLAPHLGHLKLHELTYAHVDAYITARKKLGRRSRTIILELRYLRQALQHAADSGIIAVVPKLPKLRDRDRKPHRFLTPAESERLLAAIRPPDRQPEVTRGRPPKRYDWLSYLAVLMALNLGLRKNEILTRCWQDIRWNRGPHGVLIICARPEVGFQVKMGRERAIPLTPEVRAELEGRHRSLDQPLSGWVFPSPRAPSKPRRDFSKALWQACERAGLPRIHPHGLRHTWASRLAIAGVDRRTLMELGGWKEGRMLDEIYAHATDAHMEDVMAKTGIGACKTRHDN